MKKRKLLIVLLCLPLLFASCGKPAGGTSADTTPETGAAPVQVQASRVDQALDEAFSAGRLVMSGSPVQILNPATCEIVMPPDSFWENYGQKNPGADALRSELPGGLQTASCSPDGSVMVGYLADVPVIVTDGKILVMHAAENRGVENTNHSLESFTRMLYGYEYVRMKGKKQIITRADGSFGVVREGFIWSPDGRYLCIIADNTEMRGDRIFCQCPVLTDTQTGEFFCVDTFSSLSAESYGQWLAGCFSGDGRYFWAVFSERNAEERQILRYNLDTFEKETVCSFHTYGNALSLRAAPDGGVATLMRGSEESTSLLRVGADGTSSALQLIARRPNAYLYPAKFTGSGKSGEMLICFRDEMESIYPDTSLYPLPFFYSLMHLRADEPAQADTLWVIRSDTLEPEAVTSEMLDSYPVHREIDDSYSFSEEHSRYMTICGITLSPDGRYAAVLCAGTEDLAQSVALVVIRLSDMKALPAEAEVLKLITGREVRRYTGRYFMEWTEAGLMVFPLQQVFNVYSVTAMP